MPFINISVTEKVDDKNEFLENISVLISTLTNKPKKFIFAKLEDEAKLFFDDDSPCCYLEIKSIGSLNPSQMTKTICLFINDKFGIALDKIYIYFEDVPAEMWGWNGRTFG